MATKEAAQLRKEISPLENLRLVENIISNQHLNLHLGVWGFGLEQQEVDRHFELKIVDQIEVVEGAHVSVLPRDHLPRHVFLLKNPLIGNMYRDKDQVLRSLHLHKPTN